MEIPFVIGCLNFSLSRFAAHEAIPREGPAPGVKIGVADSAYLRASEEWKDRLYLPQKLPPNGENPKVGFFVLFFVFRQVIWFQGAALKKTHVVQSHRGLIERMFARLKKWDVLFDGNVDSIETMEMELDSAMALQNLLEMDRLDLLGLIPERARFAPGSHIITPDLEPKMKIPKSVVIGSPKVPQHIRDFHGAMAQIAPKLKQIILRLPNVNVCTPRVSVRGEGKFLGGNVLQVMVEPRELEQWWVRFSVGASMKTPTYRCYAILNANVGLADQVCECKNG